MFKRETLRFTAADVEVGGSACGQWVHPVIRDPRTGRLMLSAPCGAPCFTEVELRRELACVPSFITRRQCAEPSCAQVWLIVFRARHGR